MRTSEGFYRVWLWLIALAVIMIAPAGALPSEGSEPAITAPATHAAHAAKSEKVCAIDGRVCTLQSIAPMLDTPLTNLQDEKLGTIYEVMVANRHNKVGYVMVAAEGRYYPIPWAAFGAGTKTYTLDMTGERFAGAPYVASLDDARLSSLDLKKEVWEYYAIPISAVRDKGLVAKVVDWIKGAAAGAEGEKTLALTPSGALTGIEVRDHADARLAKLDDIVFDVRKGYIAYGLVRLDGAAAEGERIAAVPWGSLDVRYADKYARLDADRGTLEAAVLPDRDMGHLIEPIFAHNIHLHFTQEPYWEVFGFVAPSTGPEGLSYAAWKPDSPFVKTYTPATVITVEGTLRYLGSFSPAKDAAPGLKLKVETADGKTAVIYAGPQQYYWAQPMRFEKGDAVTVSGSTTTVGEKTVIMAGQIQKGTDIFRLYDAEGTPLWTIDTP